MGVVSDTQRSARMAVDGIRVGNTLHHTHGTVLKIVAVENGTAHFKGIIAACDYATKPIAWVVQLVSSGKAYIKAS